LPAKSGGVGWGKSAGGATHDMLAAHPITLTPKQSNVFCWGWQPEARHRVAVCGRRFGKTYLAAREIKRAAQLAAKRGVHPDNEIWYGAPTFKQAKRVFWARLKRAIPRHWIAGKPNESECYITLKTGHVIRIVGLDNYDNLRGSGLFFFVGDEWADAQPECWEEVIEPMLATCEGHSLKIGTPKGFDHFYDAFQKGQSGTLDPQGQPYRGHKSWHYTTAQGGNVPAEELQRMKIEKDPRTFQQEYEAGFVTYAGRVIYAFTRADSVKLCEYRPELPLHIGMDFNVNPMTAMVWQEWDGCSHQISEVIIPTSNTDEMANELMRRYGRRLRHPQTGQHVTTLEHITIYPDPSGIARKTSAGGKSDISILQDPTRRDENGLPVLAPFRVLAMQSAPLVRDRNATLNSRFLNTLGERHAFVDPSCKQSITAYERLVYKEGTSDPGGFDHPVDASGYYTFVRFGGTEAKQIKIRGF
jgi:hypothetical protein